MIMQILQILKRWPRIQNTELTENSEKRKSSFPKELVENADSQKHT